MRLISKHMQVNSIGVAIAAMICQGAMAQDGSGLMLEEIIVTAQKKAQSLQEVPIAVSAISGAGLAKAGINEAMDLESLVPNLQMGQSLNNVVVTIRGISSNTFTVAADPSVAFYQDGVYKPRNTNPNAAFMDLERAEVLRGPQGTIYGRNATGGALNLISKKAVIDEFELGGEITLGNYDQRKYKGVVNVPLIENKLAGRLAFLSEDRDGFQHVNGTPLGSVDNQAANDTAMRGQLLWLPNDDVELQVIANYSEGSGPDANHFKPLHPFNNFLLYAGAEPNDLSNPFEVNQDIANSSDKRDLNVTGTLTWDFSEYQLKTIVGWQDHKDETTIDLDASELDILVFTSDVNSETWSFEAQLASQSDSPFQWIGGIYYLKEEGYNPYFTPSGPDFAAFWTAIGSLPEGGDAGVLYNIQQSTNTSWAVFGEAYYALNDSLNLTVGARYTNDEKDGSADNIETFFFGADGLHKRFFEDNAVTWKVGLDWTVDEDRMIYGLVSTGYKAGGFNMETAPPGFPQAYESEQLLAYEIGSKNYFMNRQVQLNLAAFLYDYEDFQDVQVISTGGAVTQSTTNAGAATLWGAEAEMVWLVSENITINGQYSHLNSEFDDFTTADVLELGAGNQDLSGNSFARSPDNTFTLAAEYEWRLASGAVIRPRVQVYWQDEMFLRPFNDTVDPELGTDILSQEDFTRSQISLTYVSSDESWSVNVFGNNLEDEEVKNFLFIGPEFMGNPRVGYYSPPLTYGVTFAYNLRD